MNDEYDDTDYTAQERELLRALPKEAPIAPASADRIVAVLRREGFFSGKNAVVAWTLRGAAAAAFLVAGGLIGASWERRSSLESLLDQKHLPVAERVLLLQRAGTAYVRAAQSYADATAEADSTAVEVSRQVLLGAASAVARSKLDGGMSGRLMSVFQASAPLSAKPRSIIWF